MILGPKGLTARVLVFVYSLTYSSSPDNCFKTQRERELAEDEEDEDLPEIEEDDDDEDEDDLAHEYFCDDNMATANQCDNKAIQLLLSVVFMLISMIVVSYKYVCFRCYIFYVSSLDSMYRPLKCGRSLKSC